jgi:hypothetical protein
MNEIVVLIIIVIALVLSELVIRRPSLSWKKHQLVVTVQALVLAFLVVFTETFISYIVWAIFIAHTLYHLKDYKRQLSGVHN